MLGDHSNAQRVVRPIQLACSLTTISVWTDIWCLPFSFALRMDSSTILVKVHSNIDAGDENKTGTGPLIFRSSAKRAFVLFSVAYFGELEIACNSQRVFSDPRVPTIREKNPALLLHGPMKGVFWHALKCFLCRAIVREKHFLRWPTRIELYCLFWWSHKFLRTNTASQNGTVGGKAGLSVCLPRYWTQNTNERKWFVINLYFVFCTMQYWPKFQKNKTNSKGMFLFSSIKERYVGNKFATQFGGMLFSHWKVQAVGWKWQWIFCIAPMPTRQLGKWIIATRDLLRSVNSQSQCNDTIHRKHRLCFP